MKAPERVLLLLLPVVFIAVAVAAIPKQVQSQSSGAPATATALTVKRQSIFATQTAAAPTASATGTAAPATSTPAARQLAATPTLHTTPVPTQRPTATLRPTPTLRATPTPQPVAIAVFQSDTLPAADSPGRVITLSLYEDGSRAEMTFDLLNDMPPFIDIGTWERTDKGRLTVTLTHSADQGEYVVPIVIGFDNMKGTLTAVDYDETLFGSEGLTLHAVE